MITEDDLTVMVSLDAGEFTIEVLHGGEVIVRGSASEDLVEATRTHHDIDAISEMKPC